jgi:hypothetical protein
MKRITMVTLVITIRLFKAADSLVPLIKTNDNMITMNRAGILMIPCVPSAEVWKGE